MSKLNILFSLSLLAFWINPISGQEEIQYGSNNGQYISIQNTRIYYEEYGQGTPLILLHGGIWHSMSYYGMVIPELSNHFRVIAVDSPGHGRSEQADTMSYQLMSDYISEMIDLMDLDSAFVLGCSDGSVVALLLAHDRPDKIKRIISDGGIISADGYNSGIVEGLESISPETMGDWIEWYKNLNPQKDRWEEFIWDAKKMWLDLPYIPDSTIGNIKCRTLILMGDRDFAITLEHGLELYRSIEGSEFAVIPGAGHCICDKKPELMNKIVIDFLTAQ